MSKKKIKKNHGFTRDGIEITDELIEKWAAEAERGYEPHQLKHAGHILLIELENDIASLQTGFRSGTVRLNVADHGAGILLIFNRYSNPAGLLGYGRQCQQDHSK